MEHLSSAETNRIGVAVAVNEYPGYYWSWIPVLHQWVLRWKPIEGVYSPPVFDQSLRWHHVAIPSHIKSPGVLKLQDLRKDFRVKYIVYRSDLNKFEIWSRELEFSLIAVMNYLQSVSWTPSSKKLMPPMPRS